MYGIAAELVGHAKPGGNSVRAQPMHKHRLNPTHGPFCSFFYVPPNAPLSSAKSSLYVFEDKEPVFKMINKGRSPTIRND